MPNLIKYLLPLFKNIFFKVFFVRLQRDGLVDKNAWWKERWPKFRSQYSCKKTTALYVPLSLVLEAETGGSLTVQLQVQWETLERIRRIEQDTQYCPLDSSFPYTITCTQNSHTLITYTHTQIHMQTIYYRLYVFKYSPGSNGSFNHKGWQM